MFENFTDAARDALRLADLFARHCRHDHIGPGHLLYGVASAAGQSQAPTVSAVLAALDTPPQTIRNSILARISHGDEPSPRHLPFTPGAKKALEFALRSSMALGSNHVGPEHLLAGLARNDSGTTHRLLVSLDLTDSRIESAISNSAPETSPTQARTFAVFVPAGQSIFKNGGKVYPDLATAQAAHPGQEIAPFPLQLTDGEFFDVWTKYPRPSSWGKFASYPDAFAAAEEFRNVEDAGVRISIMSPVITPHPGTDAAGRDVLLGQTVRYERVSVTIRVMDDATKEGARVA